MTVTKHAASANVASCLLIKSCVWQCISTSY